MRSFLLSLVCAAVLVIVLPSTHAGESPRTSPSETWQTALPEETGIDSAPLVEMFDFVQERQIITSTLVGLAIERRDIRDVQQPVLDFFTERTIAGIDARKRTGDRSDAPFRDPRSFMRCCRIHSPTPKTVSFPDCGVESAESAISLWPEFDSNPTEHLPDAVYGKTVGHQVPSNPDRIDHVRWLGCRDPLLQVRARLNAVE
jgi:hypothetical protein